MSDDTTVLEVPLHRSILEPMLTAGVPRKFAFGFWTTVAALVLGLHQLWVLPIAMVFHALAARVTKSDPYFFSVLVASLKVQNRLDP